MGCTAASPGKHTQSTQLVYNKRKIITVVPDDGGKKAMYLGLFSQELKSWTKLNYSLPAK